MRLLAVLGSNRPESASNRLAENVMAGARSKGYETKEYYVNDMDLHGCRGCGACRKNGTDCIIQDGMQQYYTEVQECDVLLVSSPNYYSQITGPMITFLDRHYCMSKVDSSSRIKPGKKVVGVFAQGAPESFTRYESVYDWYLSVFERHMELAGKIVVGGDSDLSEDGMLMRNAFELGASL